MKILFDQNTPVPLRDALLKHDVWTAHEMGGSTLENGNLLSVAEEYRFDLFVTADKNLKHQQNIKKRSIRILVLSTKSWPKIQNSVSNVVSLVEHTSSGDFVEIESP